jgi:hypothetical protein
MAALRDSNPRRCAQYAPLEAGKLLWSAPSVLNWVRHRSALCMRIGVDDIYTSHTLPPARSEEVSDRQTAIEGAKQVLQWLLASQKIVERSDGKLPLKGNVSAHLIWMDTCTDSASLCLLSSGIPRHSAHAGAVAKKPRPGSCNMERSARHGDH